MVDKATRVTTRRSSQSKSRGSSAKNTPKVTSAVESEDDDVIPMMTLEDFCNILRVYNNKRIAYKEGRLADPPEYPNPPESFVKNNLTVDDLDKMDFTTMNDPPTPLDFRFIQVDRYIPKPTKQPTPPDDDNPWPQIKLVPDRVVEDKKPQASTSGATTSKVIRPKRQVTKSAEAVMETRKRTRSTHEQPMDTRRKQLMTTRPEVSPAPIKRTNEVAVERPQGIVENVESRSTCASGASNRECIVLSDDSANNNSNNNHVNEQTTPERHVALAELERMVTIEGFQLSNENEEPSPKTRIVEFTITQENAVVDLDKKLSPAKRINANVLTEEDQQKFVEEMQDQAEDREVDRIFNMWTENQQDQDMPSQPPSIEIEGPHQSENNNIYDDLMEDDECPGMYHQTDGNNDDSIASSPGQGGDCPPPTISFQQSIENVLSIFTHVLGNANNVTYEVDGPILRFTINGAQRISAFNQVYSYFIKPNTDVNICINQLELRHVPPRYIKSIVRIYSTMPVYGLVIKITTRPVSSSRFQQQQSPDYVHRVCNSMRGNANYAYQLAAKWKCYGAQWNERCCQELNNMQEDGFDVYVIWKVASDIQIHADARVMATLVEGTSSQMDHGSSDEDPEKLVVSKQFQANKPLLHWSRAMMRSMVEDEKMAEETAYQHDNAMGDEAMDDELPNQALPGVTEDELLNNLQSPDITIIEEIGSTPKYHTQ